MQRFENAVSAVAKALAVLSSVTVLLMMFQTVVDVTSNNLLGRPIEGNAEIIAAYYMVMIVFLPLAFVELRHEHINADLLVRIFPPPARRAVYAFGALVSLGFFGVLTWQTAIDAWRSLQISEVMMASIFIPVWPAKFALPLGFGAIFLAVVVNLAKSVRDPDFSADPPDLSDEQRIEI
jgi:TRAP-type C4-dicarboxylate transport system permease small subunit